MQLYTRRYTEDGAKSPGHAKKRFRMMTLQQEALRAPFRGGFGGFGLTFKRIVQVTHPKIWMVHYPRKALACPGLFAPSSVQSMRSAKSASEGSDI